MDTLQSLLRVPHSFLLSTINQVTDACRRKDIKALTILLFLHCILDTSLIKAKDNVKYII